MIPKIIHQIWIGAAPPPKKLMNTWKQSTFDYILWDEEKISSLNLINQDKYDWFLDKKIYYGAADVARVEILYKYGGIYVDADYEKLKELPNKWFEYDFLCNSPHYINDPSFRIGNSFFGAKKESNLILEYRDRISNVKKLQPAWIQIGGTLLTDVFLKFKKEINYLLLPPLTFYTVNIKGKICEVENQSDPRIFQSYGRHFMASKNSKIYKRYI